MENNKFKVFNFSNEISHPKMKENKSQNIISWGAKNDYPVYLKDLYNFRSGKHKAILNRKAEMIIGDGFVSDDAEVQSFLLNKYGKEDMDIILSKIAFDLEIYNGYALQITWSRDRTKISCVSHVPFDKIRIGYDSEIEEDEFYMVSNDWTATRKKGNEPIRIDGYNPNNREGNQLIYVKFSGVDIDYYPISSYSSTIKWIEVDYEIGNYHYNSLRNSFFAGMHIHLSSGIPSDEEVDSLYENLEHKFSGTDNASRIFLTFSDGSEGKAELSPIQLNDSDERFNLLAEQTLQNILIGHQITSPLLFGIKTPGELGGSSEMLEALAIYQSVYIRGRQKLITDSLNKILRDSGIYKKVEIEPYSIDMSNVNKNNNIDDGNN